MYLLLIDVLEWLYIIWLFFNIIVVILNILVMEERFTEYSSAYPDYPVHSFIIMIVMWFPLSLFKI
jgi:hypothetical protein